ncbi:ATP-binding protein [Helicobacter pylori]|nr:ATP-binding protein [Helicobacter pylori]
MRQTTGNLKKSKKIKEIEILKKEFAEQEKTKRENLARLNEVIDLFKGSIDKVFDRVSAFTWEKYKEQNDDEEDDEINRREFEEIKKMVLYFRDWCMFRLDWYELSEEEIQKHRDWMDEDNKLLQLDYSLRNLQTLREYKETNKKDYQESLNDEELQNDLRKWRDLKNTPEETNRREFEEIKEMVLYFRELCLFYLDLLELSEEELSEEELSEEELSEEEIQEIRDDLDKYNELLQLDYSLKNLQRLREFKEEENNDYQEFLNDEELQNDLREWRRTKRR